VIQVGVMGAGAVGCYLGGRLLAAGHDVRLVGRARVQSELAEHGLAVAAFDEEPARVPAERVAYESSAEALADCDVVLVCVKSAQTADVAAALADAMPSSSIAVSCQNGITNADRLRDGLDDRRVLGAIVSFNVVPRGGGLFQQTTSGPLMVEACADPRWRVVADALAAAGVHVEEQSDLAPHQWTKLLLNLNNAISALSGAPTRDLVLVAGYRRVVAAVMAEGIAVLKAAGIRPAKLRGVPIAVFPFMLRRSTPVVRLFARSQIKIDPEARSSMWQDLELRRPTEVAFLNGEIVSLAENHGVGAPLNRRIGELISEAEAKGEGSPKLSPEQLWSALTRVHAV